MKRFDNSSFKSKQMEKSVALGKEKEFGITVSAGTGRVWQKILSNSRVMSDNLKGDVCLAGTGKVRAILKRNNGA